MTESLPIVITEEPTRDDPKASEGSCITDPNEIARLNRPLQRLFLGAALAGASLFICLALGEITLRIVAAGQVNSAGPDVTQVLEQSAQTPPTELAGSTSMKGLVRRSPLPGVVYELRPNLRATFQGQPLAIDGFSLRASATQSQPHRSLQKPPGTIRIVGLGDSVMFGWGVSFEQSYLERLRVALQEHFSLIDKRLQVDVMNFGVPGYNTAMQVATYREKASLFEPDLVVLNVINNDVDVPLFLLEPEDPWTWKKSFLFEFVRERLATMGVVREQRELIDLGFGGFPSERKHNVLRQYRGMVGVRGVEKALRELARLTRAKGVPVVVVHGALERRLKQKVEKISRRAGFTVVDLKPVVERFVLERGIENNSEARRRALQVTPTDPHPNSLGHEIYASALFDPVRALLQSRAETAKH